MFIHVHSFLLAGRTGVGNFEKETDTTIEILPLVYGVGLYKSFGDKRDSVLALIQYERQLHAFFIVFVQYFQNKYVEFLKKSPFFLDESIYNLVQIRYVEPVSFMRIRLSGIKYLQFLGKHLCV